MKKRIELTELEVRKIIAMWAGANVTEVEIVHHIFADQTPTIDVIVDQKHINITEEN